MAGDSAAERIVHPVPKSLVRDASWGTLFLAICVWWLVIGAKHLLSSKLSLSYDHTGQPCGSDQRGKYLYYPLVASVQLVDPLQPGLDLYGNLDLAHPVCVPSCPSESDEIAGLSLKDTAPALYAIYGHALTASKVYRTEQYGDFFCVPHDEAVGAKLLKELDISSWGFKVWSIVNSISTGGAFYTLLSSSLVSLVAAPALCLALILNVTLMQMFAIIVVPSLTVGLMILANKMDTFTHYSRAVMTFGIMMTSLISLGVCSLSALSAYVLQSNKARRDVIKSVLKIYTDVARCIPGLLIMPLAASVLVTITIFLSMKTSAAVLISSHARLAVADSKPARVLSEVHPQLRALAPGTPAAASSFAVVAAPPLATRKAFGTPDFVTQLGLEINHRVEGQPQPFHIDNIVSGGGAAQPPGHPAQVPKADHMIASAPHVFFKGVHLKSTPFTLVSLSIYVVCCVLLVEFLISVSNTFVAAWTIVWYYSPPEIGGSRCVEASAIRYASVTTFSSHFANIFTTSAMNALSRPLTFSYSLLSSIPAVLKWWTTMLTGEFPTLTNLYQLCCCASSVSIAHSLIHGYHLITSTKTLLNEDVYTQSVRRILRLGAVALQQVVVLTIATLSAVLTASTCALTPAFTKPHHDFYVNVPIMTSTVSFIISFYITSVLTSSILQSVDCLICCYQFERQTGSSAAYTPDEFTMVHSEVRKAAQDVSEAIGAPPLQEIETPTFMKSLNAPVLGYESDHGITETSALCKMLNTDSSINDPDAIAMYLQNNGSLTLN